jgi:hypothetical protein
VGRGEAGLATDRDGRRMPAHMGRRTVRRDTKRLKRELDRPARVPAVRDLAKARAQGLRDATSRLRDATKAFSEQRAVQ